MARFFKYAGIVVSVIFGLVILAGIAVNLIPADTYKALIRSTVKSATGRELTIDGDLDITLYNALAFKASNIKFSNAEEGTKPDMVWVGQIEGKLALFPLLRGILELNLVIDRSDLLLETLGSGKANWQFGRSTEDKSATDTKEKTERSGLPIRILVRKLHLNETRIVFLNQSNGNRIDIEGEKLHIQTINNDLTAQLSGKVNDIPLNFSGSLDNATVLINNQTSNVILKGSFGDTHLSGRGTIGPLTPTADLDLAVNIDTQTIAGFSPLFKDDLPNLGPLVVRLNLVGKKGHYAVNNLVINLDDSTLSAQAKGSIADLKVLDGIQFTAKLDTHQLAEVLAGFGYQTDYKLPDLLNAEIEVGGNRNTLVVKQLQAQISGQGFNASVEGHINNIMTLEGTAADVTLEAESMDVFNQIAQRDLPPLAPLKATAAIVSKGKNLNEVEIKSNLTGKNARMDVNASLQDTRKLAGLNADINLTLNSPANQDHKALQVKAIGSIADLKALDGIQLTVTAGTDRLTEILTTYGYQTNYKLPDTVSAAIEIEGSRDALSIKHLQTRIQGQGLDVSLKGQVNNIMTLEGAAADVTLEAESMDVFNQIAQRDLPPLAPLKATAAIVSKGEHLNEVEIKSNLTGKNARMDVNASAKNARKLAGVKAEINFTLDSLAAMNGLVKQKLPDTGPVTLKGKFLSEEGLKSPLKIDTFVKSDDISMNITGSIAEPLTAKGIDMMLNLEAASLQKIGELAGTQIQSKEPLKLEGRFSIQGETYELADFRLQVGDSDLKGQVSFKQSAKSGGIPYISGKFHTDNLDLTKMMTKADPASPTERGSESNTKKNKKSKVFPSEPLPIDALKSVDADIEVTIDSLTTSIIQFEDLVAGLSLKNGLLSLEPLNAKLGDGSLGGVIIVDTEKAPPVLSIDIEMLDATHRDFGGQFDLTANLKGSGETIAAIMAHLDGEFGFHVQDMTLKKSLLTGFGAGLIDSLNPFDKEKETTELLCAAILFSIEDGIADATQKIAALMTEVSWLGSGKINLQTEEIDFGVTPKTRKKLDISLGNLAKLIHVGGTLAEPQIELDPKDVAIKAGKVGAAIATGGITFVADVLWQKTKTNEDVCAKIAENLKSGNKPEAEKSK